MTYFGGSYPSVSGQPPHLARQNCLPASITRNRASSTSRCAPQRTMMLSGSTSRICALSSFPVLHFCQYGRLATAQILHAPRREIIGCRNNGFRKAELRQCNRCNIREQTDTSAVAEALPDAREAFPARYRTPPPHRRNGPLSGAALCCTIPVSGGAPHQGVRNLVRLSPGLALTARCSGQPFIATDLHTPSKARIDHVAHSSDLKSAATRLAPLDVLQ